MLLISELRSAEQAIRSDDHLRTFWLPAWERLFPRSLREEFEAVISECRVDASVLATMAEQPDFDYGAAASQIGALSASTRGSGTKTALLSLLLAWKHQQSPDRAIMIAANCLGSDTDTVATLVGALVGAASDQAPTGLILDRDYICLEAERLNALHEGKQASDFRYPTLAKWHPPTNQSDVVGEVNGRMAVAGLGYVLEAGERIPDLSKSDYAWQWLKLEYGQTILARLKLPLRNLDTNSVPTDASVRHRAERTTTPQAELFAPTVHSLVSSEKLQATPESRQAGIDELTRGAIDSGFDPLQIGRTLLELCEQPDGIERVIGYAAIIAKAKRARSAQRVVAPERRRVREGD
jgi:hypothetical protein